MNKPSLRKCIDNQCKECIYDGCSGNGSWREQVEACTSTKCPLYQVRPLAVGHKHTWQVSRPFGGKWKPIMTIDEFVQEHGGTYD